MKIPEAQKILARERARWRSFQTMLSDDELLRRRERLFNGFTMALALATLPTWFFGGALGALWLLLVCSEVVAARYCSHLANQCRDVRETLRSPSPVSTT